MPRATYRVQLQPGFGFDAVAEIADYLKALGISHVYLSPCLKAVPGSAHGYDVVDHGRLNDELGGGPGFARMLAALREQGLGLLLDVVPNHMAIATPENHWWWDVLENGPGSRFAAHFDVHWRGADARLHDKVLMPILGDHYGRVLEASQIRIERLGSEFRVRAYDDHMLPMAPRSLAGLLRRAAVQGQLADELAFLADALEDLPAAGVSDPQRLARRRRDKDVLFAYLERLLSSEPEVGRALDEAIARVNADVDVLDSALEAQNYRLSFWRIARHDLDYRRFFDIDTLVGLRVEREQVFEDTHQLVLGWVEAGHADGLRIDHPDGLRDPLGYLQRLRARAPESYIVVEKILSGDEVLPADWPVEGTTGYDFLNLLTGLFVDPAAESALVALYDEFAGVEHSSFEDLVREKKRLVLDELLASELNRVTAELAGVCEVHPRYRDYARNELRTALRELVACLPVYRTYLRESGTASERDRAVLDNAVACVRQTSPEVDARLLAFVERILLGEVEGERERELAARFQQLAGATMAKGQEDTAFYCDHRLVALNEVGGEPSRFGVSVEQFHAHCARMQATHPSSMLASSTHDAKRSEDVRARIALLSEVPARWAEVVRALAAAASRHRQDDLPDREMEYLLYQTLVGAWPIDRQRLEQYMIKAAREAKQHTSWRRQDAAYEEALKRFISAVLSDERLVAELEGFVAELEPAAQLSSLCQLALKLTAPGVPDFYQGHEVFRRQLTDPDNRDPVDFAPLRDKLRALQDRTAAEIRAQGDPDLLKLFVAQRLLALGARQPEALGRSGDYRPLGVRGAAATHAVAFARGERVLVVVPRLLLRLGGEWKDTHVSLPAGRFRHVLADCEVEGGDRPAAELLAPFPLAVLEATN